MQKMPLFNFHVYEYQNYRNYESLQDIRVQRIRIKL